MAFTNLDSVFLDLDLLGDFFELEDVGVPVVLEHALQVLDLLLRIRRPLPPLLGWKVELMIRISY